MAKFAISMQDELLEKIDVHCEKNYINRSAFIAQCVNNTLVSMEIPEVLGKICYLYERIVYDNEVDENTLEELKKFKLITEVLNKK